MLSNNAQYPEVPDIEENKLHEGKIPVFSSKIIFLDQSPHCAQYQNPPHSATFVLTFHPIFQYNFQLEPPTFRQESTTTRSIGVSDDAQCQRHGTGIQ